MRISHPKWYPCHFLYITSENQLQPPQGMPQGAGLGLGTVGKQGQHATDGQRVAKTFTLFLVGGHNNEQTHPPQIWGTSTNTYQHFYMFMQLLKIFSVVLQCKYFRQPVAPDALEPVTLKYIQPHGWLEFCESGATSIRAFYTLGPGQMVTMPQTTFSNAFSWKKPFTLEIKIGWVTILGI